MPMTKIERLARVAMHKKQERLLVKDGVPTLDELKPDVPVLSETSGGLIEYVKHKGVLFQGTAKTRV